MRARVAGREGLMQSLFDRFSPRPPERLTSRRSQDEPVAMGGASTPAAEVFVWGVIRRDEVLLLAHYGTSYGLFDRSIADYACVLVSDAYQLGEYVGDSARVSGPLREVIGGMPVMEVTHLELLKMKWMR